MSETTTGIIELSIVSVVWNDLDSLEPLLTSIFDQVDPETTEVIFVDNGSEDGTVEYLLERDDVIVVQNETNLGYPLAMNRGAAIARGTYVILANPDLVYRPGSLRTMIDEMESSPEIGGVSPVIETPGNPPEIYPLLLQDPGIYYGWNFFSGFMTRFKNSRLVNWNQDFHSHQNSHDIPWIHGCCGMFRKAALDSVGGGFDDRFFIYFEDSDLGRSLRREGWRLRMACGARVLHMEDQTCKRIAVRSRIFFMESWHKYLRKHCSLPYRMVAFLVVGAALMLQMGIQLAKKIVGKGRYLPVAWTYLKVHLRSPFVNLEGKRRREIEALGLKAPRPRRGKRTAPEKQSRVAS